jgi:hypothetical protein
MRPQESFGALAALLIGFVKREAARLSETCAAGEETINFDELADRMTEVFVRRPAER